MPQKRTKFDFGFLGSLAGNTPIKKYTKVKKKKKKPQKRNGDCSESEDPDCNKVIEKLIAEHEKQIGSLADEDHEIWQNGKSHTQNEEPNLIQAATAYPSYLPEANCQGDPCAISHAFEPRYTCSPELLQRLTNFILPPPPPYHEIMRTQRSAQDFSV
jgi:hypothetical protein